MNAVPSQDRVTPSADDTAPWSSLRWPWSIPWIERKFRSERYFPDAMTAPASDREVASRRDRHVLGRWRRLPARSSSTVRRRSTPWPSPSNGRSPAPRWLTSARSRVAVARDSRPGVDHWRDDADFRRFACDSTLPAIAAALLRSTAIWLYEDSVLVKEPGTAVSHRVPHRRRLLPRARRSGVHVLGAARRRVTRHRAPSSTCAAAIVWADDFRPNLFTVRDPHAGHRGQRRFPTCWATPTCATPSSPSRSSPATWSCTTTARFTVRPATGSVTQRRRAISVRYCGDDARYHLRPGAPRKPHQERSPTAIRSAVPTVRRCGRPPHRA